MTGIGLRAAVGKPIPTVALGPLLLVPYIMAYQVDLAYGNKADRIYNEANRILVSAVTAARAAGGARQFA